MEPSCSKTVHSLVEAELPLSPDPTAGNNNNDALEDLEVVDLTSDGESTAGDNSDVIDLTNDAETEKKKKSLHRHEKFENMVEFILKAFSHFSRIPGQPQLSVKVLASVAILSTPQRRMSLVEIREYISKMFPYYRKSQIPLDTLRTCLKEKEFRLYQCHCPSGTGSKDDCSFSERDIWKVKNMAMVVLEEIFKAIGLNLETCLKNFRMSRPVQESDQVVVQEQITVSTGSVNGLSITNSSKTLIEANSMMTTPSSQTTTFSSKSVQEQEILHCNKAAATIRSCDARTGEMAMSQVDGVTGRSSHLLNTGLFNISETLFLFYSKTNIYGTPRTDIPGLDLLSHSDGDSIKKHSSNKTERNDKSKKPRSSAFTSSISEPVNIPGLDLLSHSGGDSLKKYDSNKTQRNDKSKKPQRPVALTNKPMLSTSHGQTPPSQDTNQRGSATLPVTSFNQNNLDIALADNLKDIFGISSLSELQSFTPTSFISEPANIPSLEPLSHGGGDSLNKYDSDKTQRNDKCQKPQSPVTPTNKPMLSISHGQTPPSQDINQRESANLQVISFNQNNLDIGLADNLKDSFCYGSQSERRPLAPTSFISEPNGQRGPITFSPPGLTGPSLGQKKFGNQFGNMPPFNQEPDSSPKHFARFSQSGQENENKESSNSKENSLSGLIDSDSSPSNFENSNYLIDEDQQVNITSKRNIKEKNDENEIEPFADNDRLNGRFSEKRNKPAQKRAPPNFGERPDVVCKSGSHENVKGDNYGPLERSNIEMEPDASGGEEGMDQFDRISEEIEQSGGFDDIRGFNNPPSLSLSDRYDGTSQQGEISDKVSNLGRSIPNKSSRPIFNGPSDTHSKNRCGKRERRRDRCGGPYKQREVGVNGDPFNRGDKEVRVVDVGIEQEYRCNGLVTDGKSGDLLGQKGRFDKPLYNNSEFKNQGRRPMNIPLVDWRLSQLNNPSHRHLQNEKEVIPDSPAEPDEESHDTTITPPTIIPLDDPTGSTHSIRDFSQGRTSRPDSYVQSIAPPPTFVATANPVSNTITLKFPPMPFSVESQQPFSLVVPFMTAHAPCKVFQKPGKDSSTQTLPVTKDRNSKKVLYGSIKTNFSKKLSTPHKKPVEERLVIKRPYRQSHSSVTVVSPQYEPKDSGSSIKKKTYTSCGTSTDVPKKVTKRVEKSAKPLNNHPENIKRHNHPVKVKSQKVPREPPNPSRLNHSSRLSKGTNSFCDINTDVPNKRAQKSTFEVVSQTSSTGTITDTFLGFDSSENDGVLSAEEDMETEQVEMGVAKSAKPINNQPENRKGNSVKVKGQKVPKEPPKASRPDHSPRRRKRTNTLCDINIHIPNKRSKASNNEVASENCPTEAITNDCLCFDSCDNDGVVSAEEDAEKEELLMQPTNDVASEPCVTDTITNDYLGCDSSDNDGVAAAEEEMEADLEKVRELGNHLKFPKSIRVQLYRCDTMKPTVNKKNCEASQIRERRRRRRKKAQMLQSQQMQRALESAALQAELEKSDQPGTQEPTVDKKNCEASKIRERRKRQKKKLQISKEKEMQRALESAALQAELEKSDQPGTQEPTVDKNNCEANQIGEVRRRRRKKAQILKEKEMQRALKSAVLQAELEKSDQPGTQAESETGPLGEMGVNQTLVESQERQEDLSEFIQSLLTDLFEGIKYTNIEPPFSFTVLIIMALMSTTKKRLSLDEIYQFIQYKCPFYRNATNQWKTSVHTSLKWNKVFMKRCTSICQSEAMKSHEGCWRVDPWTASEILTRAFSLKQHWFQSTLPSRKVPHELDLPERSLTPDMDETHSSVIETVPVGQDEETLYEQCTATETNSTAYEAAPVIVWNQNLRGFNENPEETNEIVVKLESNTVKLENAVKNEIANTTILSKKCSQLEKPCHSCSFCGENFHCLFLLKCHKKQNHLNEETNPCYLCHHNMHSVDSLLLHVRKFHFGQENAHVESNLCSKPASL